MAILAGCDFDVTDEAGNLLTGNVTVEVRRLSGGLGVPYDGRDTDTAAPLGNPFINDGGRILFYAAGGAYRIICTQGNLSREREYVAIGTNAERDYDTTTLAGVVQLLSADEADSSEHASSTSESSALKTYSLAANSYDYIKVEAVVQSRVEQDAQTKADFTWRLKEAGSTVTGGTFTQRLIADPTTGTDSGERVVTTISAIVPGGQASTTALTITAQMTVNNAATGALVKKFRVYGIKNQPLAALEGPAGAPGAGMMVAVSNEDTPISTGTGRLTFRAPNAMTLQEIRGSLTTASSSGPVTVDVNVSGSSILSTKLTIDQGETTSVSAATPAVISNPDIADDAQITIDIDGAGVGATGLKLTFKAAAS